MGSGPKAPNAPDPVATAAAQSKHTSAEQKAAPQYDIAFNIQKTDITLAVTVALRLTDTSSVQMRSSSVPGKEGTLFTLDINPRLVKKVTSKEPGVWGYLISDGQTPCTGAPFGIAFCFSGHSLTFHPTGECVIDGRIAYTSLPLYLSLFEWITLLPGRYPPRP